MQLPEDGLGCVGKGGGGRTTNLRKLWQTSIPLQGWPVPQVHRAKGGGVMVKIVKFDPKLSTLEGTTMKRKVPAMKTITVQVTAEQYARLEKALKAAQKDGEDLKTVDDLVQFWVEAELEESQVTD
jgi:hypothetical protein